MASLDVTLNAVESALATVPTLRVVSGPAPSVSPPAVMVGWPDRIEYDRTLARGLDRWTVPVQVILSNVTDRHARDQASLFLPQIKSALEADRSLGGTVHTSRVAHAEFLIVSVGGIDYVAVQYSLEIAAIP